jgi:tetratricopeptide (TPR) repeat protein
VRLARLYAGQGEYDKACDYYAMTSLRGRPSAQFEYEYGVSAIRASQYAVAVDRLLRAVTLDPSMEKARVKLALARAYGGEPAQALLMLEQILAANPSNEEARENRDAIRAYIEKKLQEGAVAPE